MEERRIGCILAVDASNKPVGIFTEQDAVTLMANTPDLNGVTTFIALDLNIDVILTRAKANGRNRLEMELASKPALPTPA